MSTSSRRVVLAESDITQTDRLAVELVTPADAPQAILVRWPEKPTVIAPVRFAEVASAAMKVLASANVELTRIRAGRKL